MSICWCDYRWILGAAPFAYITHLQSQLSDPSRFSSSNPFLYQLLSLTQDLSHTKSPLYSVVTLFDGPVMAVVAPTDRATDRIEDYSLEEFDHDPTTNTISTTTNQYRNIGTI